MKIREITENVMPTIQTKTVTQAVMPDGSVADLDTDAGNKSTGTLFQDKDGNIGIAEPGKALEPGQTPADSNLVADPKKLKMTMDKQQKDAEMKADERQEMANGGEPEEETMTRQPNEPDVQEIRVVKETVDSAGRMMEDEDEISKDIKSQMMLDPNQRHVRS